MWNRSISPLLYVCVRVKGWKKGVSLWLPVFLRAASRLLFSLDAPLGLLGGRAGRISRGAVDSANAFLLAIMEQEPAALADVDYEEPGRRVQVRVRTLGLGRRREEDA